MFPAVESPLARLIVVALAPSACTQGALTDAEARRPVAVEAVTASARAADVVESLPSSSPSSLPATAAARLFVKDAARVKALPGDAFLGEAVWYGPRFHGKRTACGERFDMWEMTAASVVFSCDTRLRVENVANGRVVEVRVNDRSGGKSHRILDLSKGAATKLDMIRSGKASVRVTVLELD